MQQVGENHDERAAIRVAYLVSPAHSWLDPAEEALHSLWAARHYAKPLQHGPNRILELTISVQKKGQPEQE